MQLIEIFFPIFALMGVGYGITRAGLLPATALRPLSDLTFLVFSPPLLFRAMARMDFERLSLDAPSAYFAAALPAFAVVAAVSMLRGRGAETASVRALACVFSNTVMLGVPLVRYAYGDEGLSILLTIIAMHAATLMTAATVVMEMGRAMRGSSVSGVGPTVRALGAAIRASVLHPVTLPIFAGVAWSLAGLPMPRSLDVTLELLGTASSPLCLVLLGASLSQFGLRVGLGGALAFSLAKNLILPALTWAIGHWLLALPPLPLAIATITAAMPIGNNVYLFAQRYRVEEAAVSAGVLVSTLACAATLPLLLALLAP